ALACLAAYEFPGNVRELKNAVEHAVIMCADVELRREDLPQRLQGNGAAATGGKPARLRSLKSMRELWLEPLERKYLTDLLNGCGGNVRLAAQKAGVNPVTLYRLIKRRGLALERQVRDP